MRLDTTLCLRLSMTAGAAAKPEDPI